MKRRLWIRYGLYGLAAGIAHLIWRLTQHGLTGDMNYDAPYLLTMLSIPTLIGVAIGYYRQWRHKPY